MSFMTRYGRSSACSRNRGLLLALCAPLWGCRHASAAIVSSAKLACSRSLPHGRQLCFQPGRLMVSRPDHKGIGELHRQVGLRSREHTG